MFIRTTRVKSGDKTYEYLQLVESFRGKNGKPTHRVLASLNDWAPSAVANLRRALDADRNGIVLPQTQPVPFVDAPQTRHVVEENLPYLHLAVFRALWAKWRLGAILDAVLPSDSIATDAEVIEALVLHRCVEPDSKLAACAWYPRTALPEMLGVKPPHFNNSRVHRALNALSNAEAAIQEALGREVAATDDGVRVTFLDLTDTWFVGQGTAMSRHGKTKEGLSKEKVGIALLCDQRGFPLRWRTVQGGSYEPTVMLSVLEEATETGLLNGHPVVMDRAMGRGAHLEELSDAGVVFLTALVRSEFATFIQDGPWVGFDEVEVALSPRTRERDVARLRQFALDAGMQPLQDGTFVKDVGVAPCERSEPIDAPAGEGPVASLFDELDYMLAAKASGAAGSWEELAGWYGIEPRTLRRYRHLLQLAEPIRLRIRQGHAESIHLEELAQIAALPEEDQVAAFDAQLAVVAAGDRGPVKSPKVLDIRRRKLLLRRVVWFSPDLFLRRRDTVRERTARLFEKVDAINKEQRERQKPRTALMILSDIRSLLTNWNWLNLFDVTTTVHQTRGRQHHEIHIAQNDDQWQRRRRLDGFGVLVASPMLHRTAEGLVHLYFSKDTVEKDFQAIKSEVELRPVRHQTDPKVKAHVSVCMLALLLRRTLEYRLARGGVAMSPTTATAALASCALNRLRPPGGPTYHTLTLASSQQRELLAALELDLLANDDHVLPKMSMR